MTKCSICQEEKSASCFSKAQLKKKDSKCSECVQETTAAPSEPSPTPSTPGRACTSCKRSDVSFSKAQVKKEYSKCIECVAKSEPSQYNESKATNADKDSRTKESPLEEESQNESFDDGVRIVCDSCHVYKPRKSFALSSEGFCTVCNQARKSGAQATTLEDHGLVASNGQSHRKLSWVPDNLKDYLVFHGVAEPRQEEEEQ